MTLTRPPTTAPAPPQAADGGLRDDDPQAGPATRAQGNAEAASDSTTATSTSDTEEPTNEQGLTDDEQRDVQALRERDREVRAHEQAHLAAAGQYARGGIQYEYERGPDGRMYAVGGQVSVDTSKVPGDPEATLQKAETLRRAALAPANPSSQDRSVAAEMTRMAAQARQEIAAELRTGADGQASAPDSSSEQSNAASEALSCPTCGGRHSAEAHDGMTAYAGAGEPSAVSLALV